MIEFKLKPITENSWILHSVNGRIGVVFKENNEYTVIGQIEKKKFKDFNELSLFLKGTVTIEEVEEDNTSIEAGNVDGYPIKHSKSYDIKNAEYPSYSKVEGSTNRFAAGYYGINFTTGWVYSFCPKVVTLEENNWIGPFRTKLEMQNAIIQKKNAPQV